MYPARVAAGLAGFRISSTTDALSRKRPQWMMRPRGASEQLCRASRGVALFDLLAAGLR